MSSPGPRAALALAVLLAFTAGCRPRSGGKAPGKADANVKAQCGNGATLVQGPYKYENNQWGSGKAKGSFEQCLLERQVNGVTEYGWSWDFPGVDTSVFAYPEIIFGWKPWSGGAPTDPRFPLRVADVGLLAIDYDVATEASGHYNLAPEVWLVRARPGTFGADPSLLSTEIMFWVESAGEARPAGEIVERPSIEGKTWELWNKDGAGPSEGPRWRLISFRLPVTERAGSIPVHALMKYLVEKGLIDPSHYVASVEFGNEISGGRGTTWVKRFAVRVEP